MTELSLYEETELFAQIAEGDEEAFKSLYNYYLPKLYPVVLKIVRTESAVRDIIQEVFLYLWLDRDKLAGVLQPRHWIFKIAYNRSYKWIRGQIRAGRLEQEAFDNAASLSAQNITEDAVSFAEAVRLIRQSIQELPDQSRKIYRMSREDGLRPAEIARELGISPQAVKNSLYRSGKTIRDALSSKGFEIPLLIIFCLMK